MTCVWSLPSTPPPRCSSSSVLHAAICCCISWAFSPSSFHVCSRLEGDNLSWFAVQIIWLVFFVLSYKAVFHVFSCALWRPLHSALFARWPWPFPGTIPWQTNNLQQFEKRMRGKQKEIQNRLVSKIHGQLDNLDSSLARVITY